MELTEKNGQASMEEILASIRRIIAEEPGAPGPVIDLDAPVRYPKGDGLLDDPSDFDLPSMFKSPTPAAPERTTPLFGRLSEAIRAASNGSSGPEAGRVETGRAEPGLSSLKLQRSDMNDGMVAAPSFLLASFHEATGARPDDAVQPLAAPAGAPLGAAQPAAAAYVSAAPAANGFSAGPVTRAALDTVETAASHHEPVTAPEPTTASAFAAAPAPQVPRQMAAFKDTRFRGMGAAPAPIEPVVESSPFEIAATEALVAAADPHPVEPPIPEPVLVAPESAFEAPSSLTEAIYASYPTLAVDPVPVAVPTPPPVPPHVADLVTGSSGAADAAPPPAQAHAPSRAGAPIEDATADLLRPMLRQWLADNMPRMVEKALHIEVAESVKSLKS